MTTKQIASLGGLIIVGVIGFFLAFSETLIRDGHFTLPQVVWIAFILTVFSFICFVIEKIADAKEEREHKLAEAKRDAKMAELLEGVRKLQEEQQTMSAAQLKQLEEARNVYKGLSETANQPPHVARAATEAIVKNAANVLTVLGPSAATSILSDLAKAVFANKMKERGKLRTAADLLALSALGIEKLSPKDKDDPSSPAQ